MNYIQALGAAFEREADASIFSPDLVEEFAKARAELAADGFLLKIEPFEQVSERIFDLPDGRKVVRYYGRFVHAFKGRDGQLYGGPGEVPRAREDSTEVGAITFLVGASGKVTGWSDEMTGEIYGERPPKVGATGVSDWKLALPWIIICALLLGGVWYFLNLGSMLG